MSIAALQMHFTPDCHCPLLFCTMVSRQLCTLMLTYWIYLQSKKIPFTLNSAQQRIVVGKVTKFIFSDDLSMYPNMKDLHLICSSGTFSCFFLTPSGLNNHVSSHSFCQVVNKCVQMKEQITDKRFKKKLFEGIL